MSTPSSRGPDVVPVDSSVIGLAAIAHEQARAVVAGVSMVAVLAFTLGSVLLRSLLFPAGSVLATLPVGMGLLVLLPLALALMFRWRGDGGLAGLLRPLLGACVIAAVLLWVVGAQGALRPWRQLTPLAAALALLWHVLGQVALPEPWGRTWPHWPGGWGPAPRRAQGVLLMAVSLFLVVLGGLSWGAMNADPARNPPEAHLLYRGAGMFLMLCLGWGLQWSRYTRDPQGEHRPAFAIAIGSFVLLMMALHNLVFAWLQAHSSSRPSEPLSLMLLPLGLLTLMVLRRWPGPRMIHVALAVVLFMVAVSIGRNGPVALAFLTLGAYALGALLAPGAWRVALALWLLLLACTGVSLGAEHLQGWFLHAFQATGVLLLTLYWQDALARRGVAASGPGPGLARELELEPASHRTARHVGLATGGLVLVLSGLVVWQWDEERERSSLQARQALADSSLQALSTYLLLVEHLPHAMAPLLAGSDPSAASFARWSEELLRPMGPGLNLQWAPGFRLRLSSPRPLAPAAVGLDLRQHRGNGEVIRSLLARGQADWSPVFDKVEGGQAIAYYLPVLPEGEPGSAATTQARGLAVAILHLPVGLDQLQTLREARLPLRVWLAPAGQDFRLAWQNSAARQALPGAGQLAPAGWTRQQGEVEVLSRLPVSRAVPGPSPRAAAGLLLRVEVGPLAAVEGVALTTLGQVALLAALLSGWLASEFARYRQTSVRSEQLAAELGTATRLLDESVTGMLLFQASGALVAANEAGRALLVPRGTAKAQRLAELASLPLLAEPAHLALARQTLADGQARELSLDLTADLVLDLPAPDGAATRSVVLHLSRTLLGGQALLLIQVVDMTRQRQEQHAAELARQEAETSRAQLAEAAESAQAASQAKSRFLATMSHELRTPLNAMLGMAQLLGRPGVTEEERMSWAHTVSKAGTVLLNQVNDVLDYSKVEAGRVVLENEPFRPSRVMAEVVQLFRPLAQDKGLRLTQRWEGATEEPIALGDAFKLQQMLSNLVSNALKFTEAGGVQIRARQVPSPGEALRLEFSVEDTGMGIAPQAQAQLFQPFTQLDDRLARRHGGSGLGLAIVQRLAQCMGGQAGVRSQPGQGACFWFQVECVALTGPWPEPLPAAALPLPSPDDDVALSRGGDRDVAAASDPGSRPGSAQDGDTSPDRPLAASAWRAMQDLPALQATLARVLDLVQRRKYAAVPALDQLVAQLAGTPLAPEVMQARQQLDRMRYDAAHLQLTALVRALDLPAPPQVFVSPSGGLTTEAQQVRGHSEP